jgi:hypothetical protein
MATSLIGTIGPFDPKKEVIETYLARLDVWLAANKVQDGDKVVTTLAVIGAEAFEVLQSECFPDKPTTKSLKDICEILTKYYHTPRNTMSERIHFRSRVQGEKESISDYLIALKRLAMMCDFQNALESNLKEAFIHGLKDSTIKKRMLTTEVNWAQMQTQAIAMEQVQKDIDPSPTNNVNKVTRHTRGSFKPRRGRGYAHGQSHHSRQTNEPCERCHGKHQSYACPFKHSWCHACRRKGHIKSACRNKPAASQPADEQSSTNTTGGRGHGRGGTRSRGSFGRGRSIRQVTEEQAEELEIDAISNLRLYAVDAEGENAQFMVDMTVENQSVKFAIDTQASVTVVSEDTYEKYFQHCELLPIRGTLKSYSGHLIPVLGRIKVTVEHNGQIQQLNIVVVKGAKMSLLGRDWLAKLRMNWKRIFEAFSVTNTEQCDSIQAVLEKHQQVFTRKATHNTIKDFEVDLKLKPETKPVFMKARPVPYSLKKAVEDNLTTAVNDGILEPVRTSKWASPVVVAPKANKSIRICGDYKRTVNLHLDDEVYPLPTANDIFSTLAGGTVFSKLDLSNAYQQIALSDDAKQLMTINTHKGLFRYKRLPYGIKVAPAIFQSVMDQILAGLEGVCCFIDDILITSKDMRTHVMLLDQVLQRLEEYGVLVKKEKCAFAVSQVDYLGHCISGNGIRPNNDKIKAIQAIETPRNVSELKSFLGAVTFYHKFLPNFATICTRLYQLTRTGAKWSWSSQCAKAVNKIKSMLASELVLAHYDPTLPLKVASDASPYGVGAVLAVVDSHGNERPVAYASRTLTPAERNYSQLEREAVGIMFAIKRFHKYIYGRHFILVTDNKPLTSIFSPSKEVPTLSALRLQRWALALMAHNYTIEFRKTEDHGNVDMLSRFPDPEGEEETELPINHFSYLEDLPVTSEEVQKETAADPVLSRVVRYMMHGWPSSASESDDSLVPYQRRKQELSLESGCLLWGMRVVIPESLRQRVLDDLHHEHTGIVRMKMLARSFCWFPKIDEALEKISRQCEACAVHANAPPAATTVSWPACSQVCERVHVDFGSLEDKDLLILVDSYSRWIEVAVMSSTTASQTIEVLRSWFARFGIPKELVSDNGPQFTSELFAEFLRCNGVKHTLTPPYSPQTNGSGEKSVQIVKSTLKKQIAEQSASLRRSRSLSQRLDDFLITYRSTPTTATGVSPAERFLGRKLRTRLSLLRPEDKVRVKMQSENIRKFNEGDLVWVRNFIGKPKWLPGEVVRREGLLKYEVNLGTRSRLVHVDHLTKRSTVVKDNTNVNVFQEPGGSSVSVPKEHAESVPIVRVPSRAPVVNVPSTPSVRGSEPTTPSVGVPSTPRREVMNPSISPQIVNAEMPSPVRRNPTRNRQAPKRLIEQM